MRHRLILEMLGRNRKRNENSLWRSRAQGTGVGVYHIATMVKHGRIMTLHLMFQKHSGTSCAGKGSAIFLSDISTHNMFANKLRLTVQQAMTNGCPLHQLIRSLDAEKKSVTEKYSSSFTMGGLSSEQMYPGPIFLDDYNQLSVLSRV